MTWLKVLLCWLLLAGICPAPLAAQEETVPWLEEFDLPEYTGQPYAVLNDNEPFFAAADFTPEEWYGPLDYLGRVTGASACLNRQMQPHHSHHRASQHHIEPSGWQSIECEQADGGYLYNRCHLIGYQLSGQEDNQCNLFTGTRYLNMQGMLPFENMVADYIAETGHHVNYRVTPVFVEQELVARGVIMEGQSVEDDEICFNVFCFNVQPEVAIDYTSGLAAQPAEEVEVPETTASYILNSNTHKFHYPDCRGVKQMKEKNKIYLNDSRDSIIARGYDPCKMCNP